MFQVFWFRVVFPSLVAGVITGHSLHSKQNKPHWTDNTGAEGPGGRWGGVAQRASSGYRSL